MNYIANYSKSIIVGSLLVAALAAMAQSGAVLLFAVITAAVIILTLCELPTPGHVNTIVTRTLFIVFALSSLVWAWYVNTPQVSDFGVYLRCGSSLLHSWESFTNWTRSCESQWIPGFATYWRRSLLYSLPIGWLGNGSYAVFKLVNAILHIIAVMAMYRVVRATFGNTAGWISASLLALYPEFWWVTTSISSDNLVVPLLVIFIYALGKLSTKDTSGRVAHMVLAVALLLAMDWLRSIGPLLIVAIFFSCLIADRTSKPMLLTLGILATATNILTGALPALFGLSTQQTDGLLATLISDGLSHNSNFWDAYAWHQYVFPRLDPDHLTRLQLGFPAQNAVSAPALLGDWIQCLATLFNGDGYYFFSTLAQGENPDDFMLPNLRPHFGLDTAALPWMQGMALLTLCLAALGSARAMRSALGRAALCTGGAILIFIILIGEVQARYSLLLAPSYGIVAGVLFAGERAPDHQLRFALKALFITGISVFLFILGLKGIGDYYARHAPQLIWSDIAPENECPVSTTPAIRVTGIMLTVQDPCHSAAHARVEKADGPLRFYAIRQPVTPRWDHRPRPVITLSVEYARRDGEPGRVDRRMAEDQTLLEVTLPSANISTLTVRVSSTQHDGERLRLAYFHTPSSAIKNVSNGMDTRTP